MRNLGHNSSENAYFSLNHEKLAFDAKRQHGKNYASYFHFDRILEIKRFESNEISRLY